MLVRELIEKLQSLPRTSRCSEPVLMGPARSRASGLTKTKESCIWMLTNHLPSR